MAAYAILDVDIHDIGDFLFYQRQLAPLLAEVGARYLARGGEHRVYEGDYQPSRLMLLEFPSLDALDAFYRSSPWCELAPARNACCRSRIVAVEGLPPESGHELHSRGEPGCEE